MVSRARTLAGISNARAAPWSDGVAARRAVALVPYALAGLSGAAFAAAFPPLAWSPIAWLALAPLLAACALLPPSRAAVAGLCWTIAAAAGVARFLPGMLSGYFGLGAAASWIAAVAVGAVLPGLHVAAFAAWVAWLARRRAANPLLVAGGWLACEIARAHGPLGLPWALTGYSQLDSLPLLQSADFAGPHAIGFLVSCVNACVAATWAPSLRGRRPWLAAVATAVGLAGALAYGEWRLAQPLADGPAIGVAAVQAGAPPRDPAERPARLARTLDLTRDVEGPETRLVVWPEHAIDGYLEEASAERDAVLGLAKEARADLLVGGPHFAPSPGGTRYHNSAYLLRDGRLKGRYDKHRLVPFAEDGRLAELLGARQTRYMPGDGGFTLAATALRVGVSICLEAMFPDAARAAARDGAGLLVNLSNDSWFGDADAARQQLDIARLRAVENRRPLVRAAATGFSAVIDAHGRTVAQSAFGAHEAIAATVHASHVHTPYQRFGDSFPGMAIAAAVAATLRAALRRTAAPQS